ncbi:MAG: hypothetical protein Tsb0015_12700 [Simkaniaceae bacterium]
MANGQKTTFIILIFLSFISCSNYGQKSENTLAKNNPSELIQNYFPLLIQLYGGPYIQDEGLQQYLNKVANRIVRVSDKPGLDYEFIIVQSLVPHFWTLPQGKCVIHKELFYLLDNEAELAAIIAHGLAHMHLGHDQQILEEHFIQNCISPPPIFSADFSVDLVCFTSKSRKEQYIPFYTRDQEKQAMKLAFEYLNRAGYNSSSIFDLQQKFIHLERKNYIWSHGFLHCHPFFLDNLYADKGEVLSKEGYLGEIPYTEAVEDLLKKRPASQSLRASLQCFHNEQFSQALAQIDQSLIKYPDESHLLFIKGQIHKKMGNLEKSVALLQQALEKHPHFFCYYTELGHALVKLKQYQSAKAPLHTSLSFFPDVKAYYLLGKIYWNDRNYPLAKEFFQKASFSKSVYGKKAKKHLKIFYNS